MSLDPQQSSALAYMKSQLAAWGLAALTADVQSLITKGETDSDTLTLALRDTTAYKQRFAGNAERVANGLAPLSEAQYLATEASYRQVLQAYGLPSGFYDQHSDFADFIGKDISPSEIQTRAQVAHDQYTAAPDYVKNLWATYFGTQGDAVAAILDPKVATQVIQDRSTQVGIGGAAASQGLAVNQARAQQLQQAGVTTANAQKAYSQIAQAMPNDQQIAQRFGTTFNQSDEENDLLLGQAAPAQKRQTLYGEEEGLFKSGPGSDANTFGVSQSY